MLLSNSRLRPFVLSALCDSAVLFRNPIGLAISSIKTQLNRDCISPTPMPSSAAVGGPVGIGGRKTGGWILSTIDCEVSIIEDGSTWTDRKEWLAREVERRNISVRSARDAAAFTGTAE